MKCENCPVPSGQCVTEAVPSLSALCDFLRARPNDAVIRDHILYQSGHVPSPGDEPDPVLKAHAELIESLRARIASCQYRTPVGSCKCSGYCDRSRGTKQDSGLYLVEPGDCEPCPDLPP